MIDYRDSYSSASSLLRLVHLETLSLMYCFFLIFSEFICCISLCILQIPIHSYYVFCWWLILIVDVIPNLI